MASFFFIGKVKYFCFCNYMSLDFLPTATINLAVGLSVIFVCNRNVDKNLYY